MSTSTFAEANVSLAAAYLAWPGSETVSVIIPCYNEESFIGKALENLVDQYPAEEYEIVVVDGMSEDRTREVVAEFRLAHPTIALTLVDNPARNIPHALNRGIAAARGQIIARIDAHAAPSAGYIRRCVAVLNEGEAAVVGMACRVQPGADTLIAGAIATAVSHPFGIGDATYRLDSGSDHSAQEDVDTVAFACFAKSLWSSLGGFDEKLLTNEDYDFNYRVRQRGQRVVLDRREYCDYFARTTVGSLANQYLRYGFWKAQMVKQQPRSLKLRHLVAPGFVASSVLLASLGFVSALAWYSLAVVLSSYIVAAFVFSVQATRRRGERLSMMVVLPLIFFTIHVSWGSSFLVGLVHPSPRG